VGFANVQRIDAMAYLTNISVVPESSGEDVATSLLEKARGRRGGSVQPSATSLVGP
jgi:hypothetical protein